MKLEKDLFYFSVDDFKFLLKNFVQKNSNKNKRLAKNSIIVIGTKSQYAHRLYVKVVCVDNCDT